MATDVTTRRPPWGAVKAGRMGDQPVLDLALAPAAPQRVFSFRRTFVQSRSRGHSAAACVAYRFGIRTVSRFLDAEGNPRVFDYSHRRTGPQGSALPAGAHDTWSDPVIWAGHVEAADSRKNSRQCRDDVIGIPREMVATGQAEAAIAAYARRIAERWATPVHWAIHDQHGDNPHAHVIYAGRKLTADGLAFEKARDREQDQVSDPARGRQSITELHTDFWVEVAAAHGYELDFEPVNGIAQDHIGPQDWGKEKKAILNEWIEAVEAAIDPANPIDRGDLKEAAKVAYSGLTVTEALELDRDPITDRMRECPRPLNIEQPASLPAPAPSPQVASPLGVPSLRIEPPPPATQPLFPRPSGGARVVAGATGPSKPRIEGPSMLGIPEPRRPRVARAAQTPPAVRRRPGSRPLRGMPALLRRVWRRLRPPRPAVTRSGPGVLPPPAPQPRRAARIAGAPGHSSWWEPPRLPEPVAPRPDHDLSGPSW